MLLVELVSTVRTAMLRHSGAFASKVFATSRNGRFASKLCTLPKVALGTYCRNSSAFCGCWTAHAARSATPGVSSFHSIGNPPFFLLDRQHLMRARSSRKSMHHERHPELERAHHLPFRWRVVAVSIFLSMKQRGTAIACVL